jgi:hypothetical protein
VAREGLTVEAHLGLLDTDVDAILAQLAANEDSRKADNDELNQRINRIMWALVTASITLATTMILFAANLITGAL